MGVTKRPNTLAEFVAEWDRCERTRDESGLAALFDLECFELEAEYAAVDREVFGGCEQPASAVLIADAWHRRIGKREAEGHSALAVRQAASRTRAWPSPTFALQLHPPEVTVDPPQDIDERKARVFARVLKAAAPAPAQWVQASVFAERHGIDKGTVSRACRTGKLVSRPDGRDRLIEESRTSAEWAAEHHRRRRHRDAGRAAESDAEVEALFEKNRPASD